MQPTTTQIRTILFDYGGVIAEEGFRNGLLAVTADSNTDPDELLTSAMDAIYESGYVLGRGKEEDFIRRLQEKTGLEIDTARLRREILQRFRLRPWMLEHADRLRNRGYRVGILSDQTDWLDWLDARDHFFHHFDPVLNSYRLGMGKRDPAVFGLAARATDSSPQQILFIDDAAGNIRRAREAGLQTIWFRNREQFEAELERLVG